MKAYVLTTGIVFALLVVAHVARLLIEGVHVLNDPDFVIATVLAVVLAGWAWKLVRGGTSEKGT